MKIAKRRSNYLALVCIFLFPQIIFAVEANFLPGTKLDDFFNAAIDFSPDLQIASENLNISSARKRAANGQLLPQLSAGANVTDNNFEQLNRRQDFTGERYYLSLTQTLFNWQQFASRKQAHLLEDQSEEQYYYQLSVLLTKKLPTDISASCKLKTI